MMMMVAENASLKDLSLSMSPLLPSSMEEEDSLGAPDGKKRVHFQPQMAFQPTHTVFTPRLNSSSLRYIAPDARLEGSTSLAPPTSVSSIVKPNYDDSLRRVSVVLYQHIRRCEKRHREQLQHQGHHAIASIASNSNSSNSNSTINGTILSQSTGFPRGHQAAVGQHPPISSSTVSSTSTSTSHTNPASNSSSSSRNSSTDSSSSLNLNGGLLQEAKTSNSNNSNSSSSNHHHTNLLAEANDNHQPMSFSGNNSLSPLVEEIPIHEIFREDHFVTPQFKYTFVRLPKVFPMTSYVMEKLTAKSHVPSVDEIFRFCKNLFNKAQLSAECTIVCLIYIERLMEQADVPLLAASWKPIVLCGLLLASKDLSSWNVEISNIYPQYSVHSINRLERLFLHHIQWDLYISGSVYAKYYFALRSLTEKKDFRRRYNYTMKVDPPNTRRLEERTAAIKNALYSKSL